MKGHLLILVLLALNCLACKNKKTTDQTTTKTIDPLEAALPHGASLPITELSELDKQKLANAKGRTAKEIGVASLQEIIQQSEGMLYIYQFWSADCKACIETNDHLFKIQQNLPKKEFKLVLINLDPMDKKEAVDLYIREKGISSEVYLLPNNADFATLLSNYPNNGKIPALLLKNKNDGTNLLYQRNFSYEELFTIIQTVTL